MRFDLENKNVGKNYSHIKDLIVFYVQGCRWISRGISNAVNFDGSSWFIAIIQFIRGLGIHLRLLLILPLPYTRGTPGRFLYLRGRDRRRNIPRNPAHEKGEHNFSKNRGHSLNLTEFLTFLGSRYNRGSQKIRGHKYL